MKNWYALILLISFTGYGYGQVADTSQQDTLYTYYKSKSKAEFKRIVPNVPWAIGTSAIGTFLTLIDGSVLMGGVTFGGAGLYFSGAIVYRASRGVYYKVKSRKYRPKKFKRK